MTSTVIQTGSGATHYLTEDGKGTVCRPARLPKVYVTLGSEVTRAVCMRCTKER